MDDTGEPMKGRCLFLSALVICLAAGLLHGAMEFPQAQEFAYFPFTGRPPLPAGKWNLSLQGNYSNIYSLDFEGLGTNDFETAALGFAVRYGLSRTTTLELFQRGFLMTGGFLDPAIESFHQLFGLPEARRDRYPRNSVHYFYRDYFDYRKTVWTLSPLVLSLQHRLGTVSGLQLGARVFLGIPLADRPGFSSHQPFWGLGITGRKRWQDLEIFASLHTAFIRAPGWIDPEELRSSLSYIRLQTTWRRLVGGFILRTSPIRSGHFASPGLQLYAGYKISRRLEIGIIEDLPPLDTTPDIGFYIKHRFL